MPGSRSFRLLPTLAIAALAAAAFAGCGLLDTPGHVAFSSGAPGERAVVVVMPDGSGRLVIDDKAGLESDDFAPVWSPSGQQVAFLSDRDGNHEVYVAIADGSNVTRATNTAVDESQIVWSPDGTRIAYVSQTEQGSPALYWIDLANLVPVRLLETDHGETDPAWSPDGTRIAFVTLDEQGKSTGIEVRYPDTVERVKVTDSEDYAPAWSPDSLHLAFVSLRDGDEEVYAVEVGDRGAAAAVVQITNNQDRDYAPEWSPDGSRIAFLSDRDGGVDDVYASSPEGRDLVAVTNTSAAEQGFAWGPDGRIVADSVRDDGAAEAIVYALGEGAPAPVIVSLRDDVAGDADW